MEVMIGQSEVLELTATFKDGHTENVAAKAKYEISDPEVLSLSSGMVVGKKERTGSGESHLYRPDGEYADIFVYGLFHVLPLGG
ncbi:hypothetical protein [Paraprevotella clara]|uniref:hypothetical protein n=1 Tax=Paraprevotella clara TaxID=454154 RepID=UPI00300EB3D4